MNIPWSQYVQMEGARVQRSEQAAVARVRSEKHAMERIEKDYQFIREQADRIPASAGIHESMQQLNVQMNRMLQQNAEILRNLALANGSQAAERQMQELEQRNRSEAAGAMLKQQLETSESAGRSKFLNWAKGAGAQ